MTGPLASAFCLFNFIPQNKLFHLTSFKAMHSYLSVVSALAVRGPAGPTFFQKTPLRIVRLFVTVGLFNQGNNLCHSCTLEVG